jgi:hypothetical protein
MRCLTVCQDARFCSDQSDTPARNGLKWSFASTCAFVEQRAVYRLPDIRKWIRQPTVR